MSHICYIARMSNSSAMPLYADQQNLKQRLLTINHIPHNACVDFMTTGWLPATKLQRFQITNQLRNNPETTSERKVETVTAK